MSNHGITVYLLVDDVQHSHGRTDMAQLAIELYVYICMNIYNYFSLGMHPYRLSERLGAIPVRSHAACPPNTIFVNIFGLAAKMTAIA